ncbi:MAG TPA: hypothetical protein VKA80_14520 [Beijerinckiaceae bacterium]|nr:hypothetical protein [Beijerinckiaceae bacterium]
MPDPDLTLLQNLVERSLAQQSTLTERVERVERVLLHLSRQIEALPDLIALQVSDAFERRFSRIEAQMAELDRHTRTSS